MEIKKITRVTIFIDYENFAISYRDKYHIDEEKITIWDGLSDRLLDYYRKNFINNDFEVIDHTGTYLCVGMGDFIINNELRNKERGYKKRFQALDKKTGFIVRYGTRTAPYRDEQGILQRGKEKGVDAEIICQMLMGAFFNHFDACILMSDDNDYLPALFRVQDFFGKKVIHAGFINDKLRNQAYGHIPLEHANAEFTDFNNQKQRPEVNV